MFQYKEVHTGQQRIWKWIGRGSFLFLATLPAAHIMKVVFAPGETNDDRSVDFLLFFVLLALSIPVVFSGVVMFIRSRLNNRKGFFWLFATIFAAMPLLYFLTTILF